MRDFRDAKSMAHDLREALAAKHYKITVGESLEIIARLFGVSDWNTLSASIKHANQDSDQNGQGKRGPAPRFTPSTEAALLGALRAAEDRFQAVSTVEHLLLALTEEPEATAVLKGRGVDLGRLRDLLAHTPEIATPGDRSANFGVAPNPSPGFQRVVQRAILNAQMSRTWGITAADLLVAILSEQESNAARLLREHGLDDSSA